jgi:hypothetical protein
MTPARLWKSDDELFSIVQRELFTCVVGDVMDKLDLQHQFLATDPASSSGYGCNRPRHAGSGG